MPPPSTLDPRPSTAPRRLCIILGCLLFAGGLGLLAADNYSVGDTRTTGTTEKVIKRSTEVSPGIHADHVIIESQGAGTQRAPTATLRTASGTIAAGCRKLTLVFSADFAGTILGVAYPASLFSLPLDPDPGNAQGAIVYTISSGSITSYETR